MQFSSGIGACLWTVHEPDIREELGLTDIAIDGFVFRPRGTGVRLIGFIKRDEGERRIIEPTVVIHLPRGGWEKSFMAACQRMRAEFAGMH